MLGVPVNEFADSLIYYLGEVGYPKISAIKAAKFPLPETTEPECICWTEEDDDRCPKCNPPEQEEKPGEGLGDLLAKVHENFHQFGNIGLQYGDLKSLSKPLTDRIKTLEDREAKAKRKVLEGLGKEFENRHSGCKTCSDMMAENILEEITRQLKELKEPKP